MNIVDCFVSAQTPDGACVTSFTVEVPENASEDEVKEAVLQACKVTVNFRKDSVEFKKIHLR